MEIAIEVVMRNRDELFKEACLFSNALASAHQAADFTIFDPINH
jgi:hypothetical protein